MSSGNLLSTPGDGAREALAALSLNAQPPAQPVGKECATPAPWSATGALVSSGGLVGTPEFNKSLAALAAAEAAAEKLRAEHSELERKKREAAAAAAAAASKQDKEREAVVTQAGTISKLEKIVSQQAATISEQAVFISRLKGELAAAITDAKTLQDAATRKNAADLSAVELLLDAVAQLQRIQDGNTPHAQAVNATLRAHLLPFSAATIQSLSDIEKTRPDGPLTDDNPDAVRFCRKWLVYVAGTVAELPKGTLIGKVLSDDDPNVAIAGQVFEELGALKGKTALPDNIDYAFKEIKKMAAVMPKMKKKEDFELWDAENPASNIPTNPRPGIHKLILFKRVCGFEHGNSAES